MESRRRPHSRPVVLKMFVYFLQKNYVRLYFEFDQQTLFLKTRWEYSQYTYYFNNCYSVDSIILFKKKI